jgi:hypothetical protein
MHHPGYGETSSDDMVRNSIAEKHVYGTNQKVNDGEHNTRSADDSSENTTSNDTGTRSTDSGVSGTGASRRGSTDCWLTRIRAKEGKGGSRRVRRLKECE